MKRLLALALFALLALPGCSTVTSALDKAAIPVHDVAGVAAIIGPALDAGDLDGDGLVKGLAEWVAMVRAAVAAYRAAKGNTN